MEHPIEENQPHRSSFFKNKAVKEWMKKFIAILTKKNERTPKNEWKSDDSVFPGALYSIYKKLGH